MAISAIVKSSFADSVPLDSIGAADIRNGIVTVILSQICFGCPSRNEVGDMMMRQ
jgi:hypothetical protein